MQARGPNPEKAGWGPEGWGAQTQKKWGPEGWEPKPRKSGSPKGGGPNPEKVGARRVGGPKGGRAQNLALFSLFRHKNSFFSSLSGGLLVEFWWCLKRRGREMCSFGVLGAVV